MPREEDLLVLALRTVYNNCVSLFQDVEAVLEVYVVLWIFAKFCLLSLGILSVKLKVVLFDVFLGGWRDWELPLISFGLD